MISHHLPLPLTGAALLSSAVLIGDLATAAPFLPIIADATVVTLVFLTLKKASATAELVASLPTRSEFERLREDMTTVLAGHQDDFGGRLERLEDRVYQFHPEARPTQEKGNP